MAYDNQKEILGGAKIRAFHRSEIQNSPERDRSQTEMALDSLSNANDLLAKAISRLEDRLIPVLQEITTEKGEGQNRPRMSASLPEAIMTQAEILESKVSSINKLVERLAI